MNKSSTEMPLKIQYSPVSLGRMRIWTSIHQSLKMMKKLGMYRDTKKSICGVTTEYPATIVLDLTAYLFLKSDECARINYLQLRGILLLSSICDISNET